MATITLDVEKMMKKKGYAANGFPFGGSCSSGGLLRYGSLLMKKKKKASEEDDSDDDEEHHYQHRQCPHVIARAILEDLFGLRLKSEEEGEKMKKPPVKDNTASSSRGRGGVSIKEDEEGKTVKMEMPGLGKEDVKVRVVNNTLLIEGKETDDDDDDDDKNENGMKKHNNNKWGMYLPDDEYKCEELKAVMKNGVLTVVVPKKKVDEGKDVIHVLVED